MQKIRVLIGFGCYENGKRRRNRKCHFKRSTFLSTFPYLCFMETVNYTNFRSNLKHWFDKVIDDVSEVIIKRKGGKDLVLISLDEYNSLKETTYLLTGKNRDVLLNSIKELESGNTLEKELIEK